MMKNPPHPGLSVRLNCLDPKALSITQGAKTLGVSRTTLSRLINGHAGVSRGMATRLAKAFGATPVIWIRMQAAYDFAQARRGETAVQSTSASRSGTNNGLPSNRNTPRIPRIGRTEPESGAYTCDPADD